MASITAPNELHWMQSFQINPEKQKYEIVRVPEENILDISSWKSDSISSKRFLVYTDGKTLNFTILQQNEVMFDESISIDLENRDNIQFYFELYSESKIFALNLTEQKQD
jgi:hypothetical protein